MVIERARASARSGGRTIRDSIHDEFLGDSPGACAPLASRRGPGNIDRVAGHYAMEFVTLKGGLTIPVPALINDN